jgi:subtilase family serine protease
LAPARSTSTLGSSAAVVDWNQGQGTANATTTAFYLSSNTTYEAGDTPLGSRAIPILASGATSAPAMSG